MKFKLDFVELESLRDLLEETVEHMEDFEEHFSKVIDAVSADTEGEAIKKLTELSDEVVPQLKELTEMLEDQRSISTDYIEGHREINEEKGGIYRLNTDEAWKNFNATINKIEDTERMNQLSRDMENFIEDYESQMNKYQEVDSSIDLESDYEDKEEVIQYIRERRDEIGEQISNFRFNRDTALDMVNDGLRQLEIDLEDHKEMFEDFKNIIEQITDFEEGFNPGFWDKHGGQIKTILTIVGMFAGSPLSWIVAGLELAIAIGEGEGIFGAAMAFVPGDKILGKVGKVAKKADGKFAQIGKKAFGKVDELTPGCFRCML